MIKCAAFLQPCSHLILNWLGGKFFDLLQLV
jgi:hypothetical protein